VNIVIAGGTGFLGRALAARLAADRHEIIVLSRAAAAPLPRGVRLVQWAPGASTARGDAWARDIGCPDAIVNLAGESIAGRRWSRAHKQQILDSRVHATRSLARAVADMAAKPQVFVSGSAVGYYGDRGDELVTEQTSAGSDFLASVCVQWEAEAMQVASPTRVVCIRTGLVLAANGGALPQMLPPFKFGVGGRLGSGRQYWPWIHLDDWVSLVRWTIATTITGPVNATAPTPVTNAHFTQVLARALRRPAVLPAPGFALRMLLGEMADALLLSGQRAMPAKAERFGFTFAYRQPDAALAQIYGR
jgi:uncharacterized protein (TIGR01777 family)